MENLKLSGMQFEEVLRILKNKNVKLRDISAKIDVSINCLYKWKKTGTSVMVSSMFKGMLSDQEWEKITSLNKAIFIDIEGIEFKINNIDKNVVENCNWTLLSDGRPVCYFGFEGRIYNILMPNIILNTQARQTIRYRDGDITNNTRDNLEILNNLMDK